MAGDLSESTLRAALGDRPFRFEEETGSTNSDALDWAAEGAPEGAVVVAEQQTAGRGRWGRAWSSEPGRALMFSIVLRPRIGLDRAGLITTALGVGCVEGIERATGLQTRLKWPNDVTSGGRKLAGILVESRVTAEGIEAAVGGVGLNVAYQQDEFPEEIARRATSIAIESGAGASRPGILGAILDSFATVYPVSDEQTLLQRATELSDVLGRTVRIRFADGRSLEGRALRLVPGGALEIDTGGRVITVESGEVETLRSG
jgi:BirA family transcriptional regulator, biotin operon repressor / biotin---[acetyl-CoA-carboxylase] ligase